MMQFKKEIVGGFVLILLILIPVSTAITASIGNSRMILRVAPGDIIMKSILVRNDNDVPVNILVFPTGDLEFEIEVFDDEFRLEPGEEMNAEFEVKIKEEGKTNSKINVVFTPDEGNSVGLSSNVIIIASEEYANGDENIEQESSEEEKQGILDLRKFNEKVSDNNLLLLFVISFVLVIILISLIFYLLTYNGKKYKHKSKGKR